MRPVDQAASDDCVRACVASILEVDLHKVPHFVAASGSHWRFHFAEWLQECGLSFVEINYTTRNLYPLGAHAIACGISPRYPDKSIKHAVVWRDWDIVHDPHASRAGLIGDPETLIFICK